MAANTAALRSLARRAAASPAPAQASRSTTAVRAFSHSSPAAKNSIGALPTFAPTSSADLDLLLQHLRTEMFIPPHLLQRQRLLIHRAKNHSLLKEEPIFIPIGSQTVQLTPKLVHHHLPFKLFVKAVQMMQKQSDFDAIPGLAMGYAQGDRPLLEKHINMAVRAAGLRGRADIILPILEQAEFNKIRISTTVAREAFRGFTVRAGLPDEKSVIKAVRGARRLRTLLGLQDNIVWGEYTSKAAALSHAGKTQAGIEAELGPAPVKVAMDPICLGTLAGITAGASIRFNNTLDHRGYTSRYIKALFVPQSWSTIQSLLATDFTPLPNQNTRDRRETFHQRREVITSVGAFIDSIKSAEQVLTHTAAHLVAATTPGAEVDRSLYNKKLNITEDTIRDHAAEVARLSKKLRMEIPLLEQVLGRWIEVMVGDGDKVMMWSEDDTRKRLDGTRLKYQWAAMELATQEVERGEEVVEEVYEEEEEEERS